MSLDFTAAARLFMGTEEELAKALEVSVADVRSMRTNPQRVSPMLIKRMAHVLQERGKGMMRVGEMLEDSTD
jgi:hypothetical protein